MPFVPDKTPAGRFVPDQQRTTGEDAVRQLGLGTRAAGAGLLANNPFGIAADALGAVLNLGLEAAGADFRFQPLRSTANQIADQAGLPAPETDRERRAGRVVELGSGAVSTAGMARAAQRGAQMLPEVFGGARLQGAAQVFGANPVQQVTASTASPIVGETLRSFDVREPWPTVAEFVTSMATPSDKTIANAARSKDVGALIRGTTDVAATVPRSAPGRAVGAVRDVLTTEGRQNVVGRILRDASNKPDRVERKAENVRTWVAGSRPTLGQATGDVGLLRLEQVAENTIDLPNVVTNPGRFAAARTVNNQARVAAIENLRPVSEGFERLRQRINQRFQRPLQQVMANRQAVGVQPVVAQIDGLLATPGIRQRQELVDHLEYAKARLEALGAQADPLDLQGIRQDLRELVEGKLRGAAMRDGRQLGGGIKGLSRAKMGEVIDGIDDLIEAGAPGYRQRWLAPYAKARQELDRRKIVGEAADKAGTTKIDAEGSSILSAAGLERWIRNNETRMRRLTPEQRRTLLRVRADLQRSARGDSADVQGAGSSTAKNLVGGASVAAIIGRAMGGATERNPLPLGDKWRWLFGYTDRQINDLLVQALLDPKIGQKLLARANREAVDEAGRVLEDLAVKRAAALTQINQIKE